MTPFGKAIVQILVMILSSLLLYGILFFSYEAGRRDGYIQSQQDLSQGKPAK